MAKRDQFPESVIRPIRLDTLRVPSPGVAQRKFSRLYGDSIAKYFSRGKFGYPVVCCSGGVNWLLDGQHRVYAIRKAGFASAEDTVDCEVYDGLSESEMADLFLGRNRSRPVTAFDRFSVSVTAGYPRENAIMQILGGVGLKLGHKQKAGTVHSVGALLRVYERDGAEVLRRVLCILRDAYAGASAAFGRLPVDGVGLAVARYDKLHDDVLIAALAKDRNGVDDLLRRAYAYRVRLGRQLPQCLAAAVVDVYNERRKGKRKLRNWWRT